MEEEENNKRLNFKIVLASSSPRRKRILQQLKIDFKIIEPPSGLEKKLKKPYKTAVNNSITKARFIYDNAVKDNPEYKGTVVAGFDTVVYIKGKYLGKPQNLAEACKFLELMSCRTHNVITGVTVIDSLDGKTFSGHETTKVKFKSLSSGEIKKYLELEYVFDKAGAYDIHGFGSLLIERISGCFYNVAGLPVYRFISLLGRLGYCIL